MKNSKKMKDPVTHINDFKQLVLDQVARGTFVEVQEIFRSLPGYMFGDIWNVLLDLQRQGKIVLKQFDDESTGLVMKALLKGDRDGSSRSLLAKVSWKGREVELARG